MVWLCLCASFNDGMFEDAYAQGIRTFEALQCEYGVGGGCRSCVEEIQDLWAKFVADKHTQSTS